MSLRERIANEIRRDGPIPFSRYMELCLYEPELGYYSRAREQFGKAGDFYTSSDVHAVFGRLLARQFEEMWRVLDSPERIDLIELGPGRGLFARDVLDWSAKAVSRLLTRAALRAGGAIGASARTPAGAVVRAHFGRADGDIRLARTRPLRRRDKTSSSLATSSSTRCRSKSWIIAARCGLVWRTGRLVESFVAPSAEENEFLDRYGVHPEVGERVEAPLASLLWMERIAEMFRDKRGFAVLIDYGYTREEQLAGRHRDTLMTYRQHTASPSPYEAPASRTSPRM